MGLYPGKLLARRPVRADRIFLHEEAGAVATYFHEAKRLIERGQASLSEDLMVVNVMLIRNGSERSMVIETPERWSATSSAGLEERGALHHLTTLALGAAAFLGAEMAPLPAVAQTAPATPPAAAAVAPAPPRLEIEKFGMGIRLTTHGVVGSTYRLEAAEAVTGPWTSLGEFTISNASGDAWFPDRPPASQRFYRVEAVSGPLPPGTVRNPDGSITVTTYDAQGSILTKTTTKAPVVSYDVNTEFYTTTIVETVARADGAIISVTTTMAKSDSAGEVVDTTVIMIQIAHPAGGGVIQTTETYSGEPDRPRLLRDHVVEEGLPTRRDAYGNTIDIGVTTTYKTDTLQPLTREVATATSFVDGALQERTPKEFLAYDLTTDRLDNSMTVEAADTYQVNRLDGSVTVLAEDYWTTTIFGPDGQPASSAESGPRVLETQDKDGMTTRSTITAPTFGRAATGEFVPVAWTVQGEVTMGGAVTQIGDVTGAYDPNAQVTTITLPNGIVITRSDRDGTLRVGGPGRAPLSWKVGQADQRITWPDGFSAEVSRQGTVRVTDPASPFTTIISLDGVVRYRPAGGLEELHDGRPGTSTQA